jgi:phage shock protein C
MAERYKTSTERITLDETVNYTESDLKKAFESFIQEEPEKTKTNIINFTSIVGSAMIIMATLFMVGQVLPGNFFSGVSDWMQPLSILGGMFVTFTGLGFFSRRRNKKKKKEFEESPSFLHYKNTPSSSFASSSTKTSDSSSSNSRISDFERTYYDTYALKKSKKLYKSVKDKKVDGVCAGLAKYLGVSATVVRMIFIIATFMGYGSPILLYIGLSIALSKEPKILSENQD